MTPKDRQRLAELRMDLHGATARGADRGLVCAAIHELEQLEIELVRHASEIETLKTMVKALSGGQR